MVLVWENLYQKKTVTIKVDWTWTIQEISAEEVTSTSSNNTDNEAAEEKIHEPSESEGQSQGSNGEQDANEEHFDELWQEQNDRN